MHEALSSRGPGKPNRDRQVAPRLGQLPAAESAWDPAFCRVVSNLSAYDLMVSNLKLTEY